MSVIALIRYMDKKIQYECHDIITLYHRVKVLGVLEDKRIQWPW